MPTPDECMEMLDYEIEVAEDKANNPLYQDAYRDAMREMADRLKKLKKKFLTPIN